MKALVQQFMLTPSTPSFVKRPGPPARKPAGPPPRAARPSPPPRPFTDGKFVRIAEEAFDAGTFMLVMVKTGMVLGPRLDKLKGSYPDTLTRGLTMREARESAVIWEKFIELNQ